MKYTSKIGKILNRVIQLLILVVTYFFIFKQIFYKTDLPGIIKNLEDDFLKPGFLFQILIIFLMMIANWSLETLKWKLMIGKIERVSFFKSFQAVLTGISVSSFTPNRIGEYLGRAFILKNASHIDGILITVLGSMCQLMVTVVVGSITCLFFLPKYFTGFALPGGYFYYGIVFITILLDLLLIGLLFNISFLNILKEKIFKNGLKRFWSHFQVFSYFTKRQISVIILLSSLRYIIFSSQFYLLLKLFGVPVPFFDALMLISMIYFIMAVIPTIALTELGIRGSIAIYIFGFYFSGIYPASAEFSLGIFSASTLLWMINLGIPALIGTFFVFRLQFFRKSSPKETN